MRAVITMLLLTACGAESGEPENVTPAGGDEPAAPEAAEATPATRAPAADIDAPTRAPLEPLRPEARSEIRAAMRAGRGATRAGEAEAAIGHFDRALELNPSSAVVHCEAGFAALGSETTEHRQYAEHHLELGLALFGQAEPPAPLRAPLAMCLYNRGLLAERQERFEHARDSYERSLELRENATVRRHLTAVQQGRPVPLDIVRASSLEALAERLQADAAAAYAEDYPQYEYVEVNVDARFAPEGDRPEVGVLTELADSMGNWGSITSRIFAVRADGGYWTAERFEGRRLQDEEVEWDVSSAELIAPGWLRIDYAIEVATRSAEVISPPDDHEDEDAAYCYFERSEESARSTVLLCRLTSTMRCTALSTRVRLTERRDVDCADDAIPDWAGDYADPSGERDSGFEMRVQSDPARGIRAELISGDPEGERHVLPTARWLPLDEAFALGSAH